MELAGGRSRQPGDYRCTACSWAIRGGHRTTPRYHVQACHEGARLSFFRLQPEDVEEEKKRRAKELARERCK